MFFITETLLFMLITPLRWRKAGFFAELFHKIFDIGKTAALGNLVNLEAALFQKSFGFFQTQALEVFIKINASVLLELFGKPGVVYRNLIGNHCHIYVFGKVGFYVFQSFGNVRRLLGICLKQSRKIQGIIADAVLPFLQMAVFKNAFYHNAF